MSSPRVLAPRTVAGERLAGRASRQEADLASRPQLLEVLSLDVTDVFQEELRLEVLLVRVLTGGVEVDAGDDFYPGLLEAKGQAAGAAEQVDGGDRRRFGTHDCKLPV